MRVRRFAAMSLAASMLLLSGCSRLFEKEYVSTREYEDPEISSDSQTQEIHNYTGLMRFLNAMVASFDTERSLIFTNYDGIIADDLSKACWELRSNTALGDYCVEDIEYTTEQVVAYCEADITVHYKRSEEEVKGLVTVQTRSALGQAIASALSEQKTKLAVLINTNALDESDVEELIKQTCLDHPADVVVIPETDVVMYSGETNQRIFEIFLRSSIDLEETEKRRAALEEAIKTIIADLDAENPVSALTAAAAVAEQCESGDALGCTAYDALVLGRTDSQGLAMAYRAVCDALDVPCHVVDGQLDGGVHVWNLVQIEGKLYNLDLYGYQGTLWLQPDGDIWGRYWWNVDQYPACESQGFSWRPGEELQSPAG